MPVLCFEDPPTSVSDKVELIVSIPIFGSRACADFAARRNRDDVLAVTDWQRWAARNSKIDRHPAAVPLGDLVYRRRAPPFAADTQNEDEDNAEHNLLHRLLTSGAAYNPDWFQ